MLQNTTGRFEIGISDDVRRRCSDDNSGKSRWTRDKGPWSIVWQSQHMSLSDARKLGNRLKKQNRGDGFYKITGLNR